ncbi:MAG: NADPH:quinone reductase [Candidatus Obscuribacterales bacterium]|nr:NADPH:quinone reductase [Candidatus Obscuribacterales bacterium]
MKAAFITETGGPEVIQIGDLPNPAPGPEQVLIEVIAAAVDPIDTYIRSGRYKIDLPKPFIIGRDMIGVVRQIGISGSTRFKVDDKVWCNNQGYGGRQGAFAELICVDEELLYPLPPGIDAMNALAAFHSALTSAVALKGKANLATGETIFIRGGSGNVGINAIQLAKSIGARVIVTAGSDSKAELCRQTGADSVINYKDSDLESSVKSIATEGVEVYWDLTLQPDVQMALNLVKRRGRILLSSGLTHSATFNVGEFYTRNCSMFGFTITDLNTAELSHYAEIINEELRRNTFKCEIAKILPLSESALAHTLVEQGSVAGKVIVQVGRSAAAGA